MSRELLFALIQAGLTVSAAALLLLLLRRGLKQRYPARLACLVWALLAIRLLIPVQLTVPDAPVRLTPLAGGSTAVQTAETALDAIPHEGQSPKNPHPVEKAEAAAEAPAAAARLGTADGLIILWGLGAAACALRQCSSYRRYMRRLRAAARPACSSLLQKTLAEQQGMLKTKKSIPLFISPAADCPMLAGISHPALYLPDENLSGEDAAFIFRHELMHDKRHDLWLKLLLAAAQCIHWFNPLVFLMVRCAQEDIELACDAAVVRGMNAASRRAYGETILRSAETQVRKRALISCFAGDKQALLRRFEGLFSANNRRRGAALIAAAAMLAAMFGCSVSVGEQKAGPTAEELQALGAAWAAENLSAQTRYAVLADENGQDAALIITEQADKSGLPQRTATRLLLVQAEGVWSISGSEPAISEVNSVSDFRALYENDLGLPDFSGVDFASAGIDASSPREVIYGLLHISTEMTPFSQPEPTDQNGDGQADTLWCKVEFLNSEDSSRTLSILLKNPFGTGWLPADWEYSSGENNRTSADLAQQFARAVFAKNRLLLSPVLSSALQNEFENTGEQSFSPDGAAVNYKNWVLAGQNDSLIVVFQKYGGGITDARTAYAVSAGKENGRTVITAIKEAEGLSLSDRFALCYTTGLAWPEHSVGESEVNGAAVSALRDPQAAAQAFFAYFDQTNAEGNTLPTPCFTAETLYQGYDNATVHLSFSDDSAPVEITMKQSGGIWVPAGLAAEETAAFSDITSAEYTNERLGFTLSLPESFVGGYVQEYSNGIALGVKNAYGDTQPYEGGVVVWMEFQPTEYLTQNFGEDWENNFYSGCKALLEEDGLSWFLSYPTDVQYDTTDEAVSSAYQAMGNETDKIAFTLLNPTEKQQQARLSVWLNATLQEDCRKNYTSYDYMMEDLNVSISGGTATVVYVLWEEAENRPRRAVRQFTASADGGYHIIRQDTAADETAPTDSESLFRTRFGGAASIPKFERERIYALLDNTALQSPETAAEWVFCLSGGSWEDTKGNSLTYRWPNGGTAGIVMQAVTLSGKTIYLPISANGVGWGEYNPYTLLMHEQAGDLALCSTEELFYYFGNDWCSGDAYTAVLQLLLSRRQEDITAVDQLASEILPPAALTMWQEKPWL